MRLLIFSIKLRQSLKKVFFKFSPVLKFKVLEDSMMPTLYPGNVYLGEKFSYLFKNPRPGDLVVIKVLGKLLIKRVVDYYRGEVLVLGDNLKKSVDSRYFGLINKKDIIARVISLKLWK